MKRPRTTHSTPYAKARIAAGLTQPAWANRLKVKVVTIAAYENGTRRPSLAIRAAMSMLSGKNVIEGSLRPITIQQSIDLYVSKSMAAIPE